MAEAKSEVEVNSGSVMNFAKVQDILKVCLDSMGSDLTLGNVKLPFPKQKKDSYRNII